MGRVLACGMLSVRESVCTRSLLSMEDALDVFLLERIISDLLILHRSMGCDSIPTMDEYLRSASCESTTSLSPSSIIGRTQVDENTRGETSNQEKRERSERETRKLIFDRRGGRKTTALYRSTSRGILLPSLMHICIHHSNAYPTQLKIDICGLCLK